MTQLDALQRLENGIVLESDVLNRHLACRLMKNQNIGPFVKKFDMVYYNSAAERWVTSGNTIPQGMYVGNNIVVLEGLVTGLSGLTPSSFYYMRSDGSLVPNITTAFNGVKVGFSKGNTQLILDIEVVGINE